MVLRRLAPAGLLAVGLAGMVGCAGGERASVRFSYMVQPERPLPPGMKTIYVEPAKLGPTTDPKWSEMSATILQSLVNESRSQFDTQVAVSDRRDTQVTFDEADLKAAGMSTEKGGSPGALLGAQGAVLSNIDVKVETHKGKERTISGIDIAALTGRHVKGGSAGVQTSEVETVSRNMTVLTNFRLLDTSNNKVWEQSASTHQATDRTKSSPFFGRSMTEAELTPQDRIVGTLVERGAREFLSKFIPVRIEVTADLDSSSNKNCAEGVRMLRSEDYDQALVLFQAALRDNANDHRAAFGAGIAAEASGKFQDALQFYQQACRAEQEPEYVEARDRMKAFGPRAKAIN